MELQNLDQQLKVAIQNHQVLVTKMKTDPQNGALQKQLHELQSQIKGLSEKQKQVVQQLRKDLEIKQQAAAIVVTTTITTTTLSTTQSTNNITLAPPPTTTTTSPMNFQSNKNTQNLIKVLPQSSPLSLTTKRPEVVVRGPSKGITVSAAIILPNKKSNFMAALGLITHDTLTELQSRRSERKRRTTANPQFSYGGNWEHPDRKCNTNYLSGSLPPGFKRPRGRPRIGSSTTQTGSRPSTPEDILRNGTLNGLQSLCNGILVKDSECCVICREKGNEDVQLVCDNCSHAYHRRCLNSQTKDTNEQNETEESRLQDLEGGGGKSWNCPKCLNKKKRLQEWPSSLAVVHSYLAHKATKEEEKRKLLKRSTELKTERNQLQERAKQLGDAISQHVQKRSDIMANTKETMESIDRIKNAIRVLQAS